jgi:hypothetical protein
MMRISLRWLLLPVSIGRHRARRAALRELSAGGRGAVADPLLAGEFVGGLGNSAGVSATPRVSLSTAR